MGPFLDNNIDASVRIESPRVLLDRRNLVRLCGFFCFVTFLFRVRTRKREERENNNINV